MSRQITIATSIAPFDLEIQHLAVSSWIDLGFKVVSVNSPEEATALRARFHQVDFQVASRDASHFAGKPYVYFDDVLEALRRTDSQVLGIINSDIHLRAQTGFSECVDRLTQRGLVFAHRHEVEALGGPVLRENTFGVDVFFFERPILDVFSPTEFCLGLPWWDTWALWKPLVAGIELRQIVDQIAFHVDHPSRWSKFYPLFGKSLLNHLFSDFAEVNSAQAQDFGPRFSCGDEEFAHLALTIISYALGRAEKIQVYPGGGKSVAARYSVELVAMATQLQSLLEHSSVRPKALERQLSQLQGSWSWRLTSPLRWLKSLWFDT